MNRTIRARIHESAVKRVTRIYAATLAEILVEAMQNSRRAGATRVRIAVAGPAVRLDETDATTGDTPLTVTISDDGAGIADPAVLLSFGENGWDDELVRREDAAGFGFASLARRDCAVSSRPRSPDGEMAPGWRATLVPEHFPGEADAEVRADEEAPFPHGTAISFQATESIAAIRNAAENAARHYPLPVVFEDRTEDDTAMPEELPRHAFLDGAIHAEPWRGLVFGVFRNRRSGYRDPDLSFFGLTLTVGLPTVETVHGAAWTVLADVDDCPDLELVLPARKEAVENAFLKEMREAARLAIYRAMAADPSPRPAFEDWTQARDTGIEMAPPSAVLRPWRPSVANVDDWHDPPKLAPVGQDALVVDCDPEPPEAQALWRAAEREAIANRLFEPDRRLEGSNLARAFPVRCDQFFHPLDFCFEDAKRGPRKIGAFGKERPAGIHCNSRLLPFPRLRALLHLFGLRRHDPVDITHVFEKKTPPPALIEGKIPKGLPQGPQRLGRPVLSQVPDFVPDPDDRRPSIAELPEVAAYPFGSGDQFLEPLARLLPILGQQGLAILLVARN